MSHIDEELDFDDDALFIPERTGFTRMNSDEMGEDMVFFTFLDIRTMEIFDQHVLDTLILHDAAHEYADEITENMIAIDPEYADEFAELLNDRGFIEYDYDEVFPE